VRCPTDVSSVMCVERSIILFMNGRKCEICVNHTILDAISPDANAATLSVQSISRIKRSVYPSLVLLFGVLLSVAIHIIQRAVQWMFSTQVRSQDVCD
jgi:hypothetical protein